MLMDWMCLTLGRDPEMDAGNYDGEMALCRLGSPAKPTRMASHPLGSIQEKPPLWKGSAHAQLPWLLPRRVVQRVMTLEPSRRWVALSLRTRDKNRSL